MKQQHILDRMFRIGLFALLFGATSVFAQTGKTESAKDASGMTQENKSGQMSPTGQNETTSATPSSGSSSATGQSASGTSAGAASAGKSGSATLSKADQNIMRDMAHANLSEIEAGKIALNQSKNDQVRNFAQRMIDDHTQAQKDLEQLAQSKGVTLPTEPDKKHMAMAKKLGALEGDKFDKQYMSQGGMRDHRDTHKLLQRAQTRAKDAELKALAAKMEPIVSQHMTMAQDVSEAKTSTSGSTGPAGTSSTGSGSSGDAGTSGVSGTSGSSNSTSPGKQ